MLGELAIDAGAAPDAALAAGEAWLRTLLVAARGDSSIGDITSISAGKRLDRLGPTWMRAPISV